MFKINFNLCRRVLSFQINKSNVLFCRKKGSIRTLTTSSVYYKKKFLNSENSYAHSILQKDEKYKEYLYPEEVIETPTKSSEELSAIALGSEDLVERMKSLIYLEIVDPNVIPNFDFDKFGDFFQENIKNLSDEDLLKCLSLFRFFPDLPVDEIDKRKRIWSCIDQECLNRIDNWNIQHKFKVLDLWYHSSLVRKSSFVWHCLKKIGRTIKRLNHEELIMFMFFVNLSRRLPDGMANFDLEYYLSAMAPKFTVDECSLVSLGAFKSQTKFKNKELVSTFLRKLLEHTDDVHEIGLASLLKMLRYSLSIGLADQLYYLQTKLVKQVPRLSLTSLCHVALSGTSVQIYHEELINSILQRFLADIENTRIKELERFTLALAIYNIKNEEYFSKLIENVRLRTEEIENFPKCFLNLVNFLTISGYFPDDFINKTLDPKFVETLLENGATGSRRVLSYIDSSVEIERPDYKGNRLDPRKRKNFIREHIFQTENQPSTAFQKFAWEIEEVLKGMYGKQCVVSTSILQHFFHFDFIFGFDSKGNAQVIPEAFRGVEWGKIRKSPDNKNKWICMIIGGWNTNIRNSDKPLGTLVAKMRQLEILGYIPVVVYQSPWKCHGRKEEYIQQLVDEKLQNKLQKISRISS